MSEVHLRFRITTAKTVVRTVPVKSLTGFVVESGETTPTRAEGIPFYDDEGKFQGVASIHDKVVTCPHCGGNFPVYGEEAPNYCGWCGERL